MADFKIQRGTATILTTDATVTITAGVNYTAPVTLASLGLWWQAAVALPLLFAAYVWAVTKKLGA